MAGAGYLMPDSEPVRLWGLTGLQPRAYAEKRRMAALMVATVVGYVLRTGINNKSNNTGGSINRRFVV